MCTGFGAVLKLELSGSGDLIWNDPYANLLYSYEIAIQKSSEAQEKFVKFLPRLFPRDFEGQSFQYHFNVLIQEEVSLFNTHYLKRICNIFSVDTSATTKQLVDSYEQQRQNFMASTTVNQFKKIFPASATPLKIWSGKVPVKLKLDNKWGNDTIKDLTELIIKFGVPGSHLHLSKVEDGCIASIFLCSINKVEELKIAIFEAADLLQSLRVLQVFIGEDLVLECSQPHSAPGDLIPQPMVHSPSVHQSALLPTQFKSLAHNRLAGATVQCYSDSQLPPTSATELSAPKPHAYGLRNRPTKSRMQKVSTQVDTSGIKDIPASAQLWEFLLKVLKKPKYSYMVSWENQAEGIFHFHDPSAFAALWGRHRNRPSMTYDKVARALRYYYKRDILEQIGRRLTYKFSKRLKRQFMDNDDTELTVSQKDVAEIPIQTPHTPYYGTPHYPPEVVGSSSHDTRSSAKDKSGIEYEYVSKDDKDTFTQQSDTVLVLRVRTIEIAD